MEHLKGGRANVEVGEKELVVVCRLSVSSFSNTKIQHQQSGLSFIVIYYRENAENTLLMMLHINILHAFKLFLKKDTICSFFLSCN